MRSGAHSRLLRCQHYLDSLTRIPGSLAFLLCCSVRAFAVAPSDVHFTLAVTKSPAVYHLGERIVCELSFSTSKPGKYGIYNTGQPRGSWGSGSETFIATPPNSTVDPHVDLSRQLGFVIAESILSSYSRLSSVPHVVRTDLNEWLGLLCYLWPGQRADYPGNSFSCRSVNADDLCVGVWRPDKSQIEHFPQLDVVGKLAPSAQQAIVFLAGK